jgi:hypothetical protein
MPRLSIVKRGSKVCAESADKKSMFRAINSFVSQLHEARQNMFKVPEAAMKIDSSWYAGMAINPVEYSQQLSRLQLSLQGEAAAVGAQMMRK